MIIQTCMKLVIASVVVLLTGTSGHAAYPERPVALVVPFAAGGGTDIIARLIAKQLSVSLKQSFVVENKPGAGGMLGASLVAKSAPDGHTLLMGTSAELTIGPNLQSVPYNPLDFEFIALVGLSPNVVLTHPGFAARSITDLVRHGKNRPNPLEYGSGGFGTSPHMSGELLSSIAGIRMTHIPYKGTGPAMNDLIGGHISLMISTLGPALPMLRDRKVNALAVTSLKRSSQLPDVPTVAEQGLRDYESVTWYALIAPAGTPQGILDTLRTAVNAALQAKDLLRRMEDLAIEPAYGQPDAAAIREIVRAELATWGRLIKTNNIRAR